MVKKGMVKVLLLLLRVVCSYGALTCSSISAVVSSDWCNTNCNFVPSFCPTTHCTCSSSGSSSSGSGSSSSSHVTCQTKNSLVSVDWCNSACNNVPPFCPSALCDCAVGIAPSPSAMSACIAIQLPATDNWCSVNCNNGYCPSAYCACASAGSSERNYLSLLYSVLSYPSLFLFPSFSVFCTHKFCFRPFQQPHTIPFRGAICRNLCRSNQFVVSKHVHSCSFWFKLFEMLCGCDTRSLSFTKTCLPIDLQSSGCGHLVQQRVFTKLTCSRVFYVL
eukprot:c2701_g1_i2.p1 GENE.c2701_g1_i2~~c2701_g1_i2.p1  ORF type:complete len:276 (-),score=26.17 c2701_g1_i2:350-1177(-)